MSPGDKIGRYEVVELLGRGGMGTVYKAWDTKLQRMVALKVMHEHLANQPAFQERFQQEARTSAMLVHPGIVRSYDFDQEGRLHFIVMEYVAGPNLRQKLDQLPGAKPRLPLGEAAGIIRTLASAIDYAHAQGVLHRDLKPENILLRPEPDLMPPYYPVLSDMGIAKLLEGGMATQTGMVMGTAAYMSPEQALSRPVGPTSDIYSLGIILYELVLGVTPFRADTDLAIYRVYDKHTPPPAPRTIWPQVSPGVEAVLLLALEQDSARRFASARQLSNALDQALSSVAAVDVTAVSGATDGATQVMVPASNQNPLGLAAGATVIEQRPSPFVLPTDLPFAEAVLGNCIRYFGPGGSTGTAAINAKTITIGSGSSNMIVLNDQRVAPEHIRLEFDDKRCQITRLSSTADAYLNESELLTGVRQPWLYGTVLRVGDTRLQVVPCTAAGRTSVEPVPDAANYSLHITATQLQVEPGQSLIIPVLLRNSMPNELLIQLQVVGVPASWQVDLPGKLSVGPSSYAETQVTLRIPRAADVKPGPYQLTVQARSEQLPGSVAQVDAPLAIGIFYESDVKLASAIADARKPAILLLKNLGNVPQRYQVQAHDVTNALDFRPGSAETALDAGQSSKIQFTAVPKQRSWFPRKRAYPVRFHIVASGGDAWDIDSQLVSTGMLAGCAVLSSLLLIALLAFVLLALQVFPTPVWVPAAPPPASTTTPLRAAAGSAPTQPAVTPAPQATSTSVRTNTPPPTNTTRPQPTRTPTLAELFPQAKRINIARGSVPHGQLQGKQPDAYVFAGRQGEKYRMNGVLGGGLSDQYEFYVRGLDGTDLGSGDAHHPLEVTIPSSQDYYLVLTAVDDNQNRDYYFQIMRPPVPAPQAGAGSTSGSAQRIQFGAGATSGTVSGTTPKSYVLRAMANQTMQVEVTAADRPCNVNITTGSGQTLGQASSTTAWLGPLPESGDYHLSVQSSDGQPANFTITVTIV